MSASATKAEQPKVPAVIDRFAAPQGSTRATAAFVDNRAAASVHRQQQQSIANSSRLQPAAASQALIAQSPRQQAAQLKVAHRQEAPVPKNNTGLPDQLKAGVESLSGYSLDDVRVHYNSAKPAQLQAHAYAQGTDIHLAPGQEQHLPHEAWHVVQQKQGRVKPTMQLKGKVKVNDEAGLEKEADAMGKQALQQKTTLAAATPNSIGLMSPDLSRVVVQRVEFKDYLAQLKEQVVYRLVIDNEEVIAQYLGNESQSATSTKYWFGNVRRRNIKTQNLLGYNSGSNFYIRNSDKFDISEYDSAESSITREGFSPITINWKDKLADYSARSSKDWKYEKITSVGVKWLPSGEWQTIGREVPGSILTFPALETDLIVENSAAYVKDNFLVFLYEPELTAGFQFTGDSATIIRLLAFKYANLNQAAEPRSGKARAAADTEEGNQRTPSPNEAEYSGATKTPVLYGGNPNIDKNTSISISSSDTGSKVVVKHTGPWKKGDRGAGQAAAMGGQNAKNYVVDYILDKKGKSGDTLRQELGGRFEWLHVVGSSLGGINVKENLVAGSYDANTKMIALEHRIARWGTRDYSGEHAPSTSKPILITGESETYRDTRVGKSVKLTVKHGDKQIATGDYKVDDQTVITKSQYAAEEKRVDEEVKNNS